MTDDPRALAELMWTSGRPALMDVWCGHRGDGRHRLAKVYDVPGVGRRIVVPGFSILTAELGRREIGGVDTFSPYAYDIDDDAAGDILARCNHGAYLITRSHVREYLAIPAATRPTCLARWSGRSTRLD